MPASTTPEDGIAWITGASTGIGRETAHVLADQGWTVIASARSADRLDDLAKSSGGKIIAWPLDVTDADACAKAVEEMEAAHGPVALAILNAGRWDLDRGRNFTAGRLKWHFDVNLYGVAHCLEPLIPRMSDRKQGQIALVASIAGYRGLPTGASYCASKAALINLAEGLKFDFDKAGIKLQLVNPGFVDTPLTAGNKFPMPDLISADQAARDMVAGFAENRFEINMPRRLPWLLRRLRALPYAAYFWLVRKGTGM